MFACLNTGHFLRIVSLLCLFLSCVLPPYDVGRVLVLSSDQGTCFHFPVLLHGRCRVTLLFLPVLFNLPKLAHTILQRMAYDRSKQEFQPRFWIRL